MIDVVSRTAALKAMLAGPLFCGIGSEIVDGAIVECGDVAYERQPVVFGEPYEDGANVSSDNENDLVFAAWAQPSPVPMTVWFITTAQVGEGRIVAADQMEREIQPGQRDTIRFWPGDLTISLEE